MNAKTRNKLEMGFRALEFSRAHPDESPGYAAALARLEELLNRSTEVAARQRDGLLEVRAATAGRVELTHSMRRMRQKELLIKHGLVERVLESLVQSLEEFDAVVEQGAESRWVHIGASAELDVIADEVVQIVKVIDGLNRFRFAKEPELLASWKAASNVIGPPRSAEKTPSTEGEIKPAA